MIKGIQELNFPSYATLSSATVTLNDMGDRTISAQVKIDGSIVPDFSYDWEVEFKGERYIQPLRQPQASKGNESMYSLIDLTFYHKTIYDLKRYFFVEMASTTAGTAIADKYIASLAVNLKDFCVNFQNVLDYYFNGEITISLNPDWVYAEEPSFVEINYSHIWDVLLKIHEVYGVHWHIEGNTIFIGYPTDEVAHIFEYGFEGGLLKVERQVQSADICNSLLGRGGEKNLPYRYFKDASKDAQGNEWKADPDWIPELASVNFTNLRGKTFRDYIKGWKAQRYGGTPMSEPTEEYNRGYADSAKSEDGRYFNPIEYVEDKDSIEKYGLLQNGLDNVEDIFPTIQDVEVEGIGRVDEIVGAEQVIIDEATSDYTPKSVTMSIDDTFTGDQIEATNVENEYILHSDTIHQFNEGSVGYILSNPLFKATVQQYYLEPFSGLTFTIPEDRDIELISYKVIDADTNKYVNNIVAIPNSLKFKIEYRVKADIGNKGVKIISRAITSNWSMSSRPFAGEILENLNTDGTRKSVTIAVPSKETKSVTILSDTFTIPEDGATNIDVPVSINTDLEGEGLYEWKRNIEAVNTETDEVVTSINIPQGTYYLRVKVEITNNSDSAYDYKVELLPSYILYPADSEEFKPTFDIWVKNIWNTSRNAGESDQAYADRVWLPILGDREGNEPKVVFTTGRLSGHSDWEFKIHDFAYAGGDGVEYNGVKAEWRLTLVKSEAEIEATGKWIPSTMQQASVGDHFFFIGIDMPHQYILWAEERLDDYKRDKILDTANIKPTWLVQTDKVRLNEDENGTTLLDSLKVGNSLLLADTRFIEGEYERLYLQSITYSWDAQTILYPNVEVVLADKPITTSNPVAKIQGDIEVLNRSAVKTSDVQNLIITIGDKIYLRKDGLSQASNSPTIFNQPINSAGYRQGAFGGRGWGLRNDGEKGILEVDSLVVRDNLQVNTIVSNQIESIGGKQIESAARITCTKVEDIDGGYKCYFDQKQGSVVNLFKVNDIALSQVFSPDNSEVKYYKRVVIAIDNNSITLSKTQVDGNGMPQEGDVIVHYGNTTDTNRQYVIIRDVIGGGYERMLSDLNSVSATGVEYYFAGRMDGDTPRWFVGNNNQFIEYKDGHLQIKADVTLGENSSLPERLDVEYLKKAFPKGNILDVNDGVSLASLIGVNDENGNLVAGLYGGGSVDLNEAGYEDADYGAMLLFGGIEGADKPTTYKTAIFENGHIISKRFQTGKEGKRVEIFDNELLVYGDDEDKSVLSISYDSNGKPRLQYSDKNGNVSWYLTDSGLDNTYSIEEADNNFISKISPQDVNVIHNFSNGFKVGGIPFRKMANGSLFIDANVVFGGGATMYGTDTTPAPSIFDGLPIDNETIYWDNGVLKAMGGGGVADSVAWANVTGKPSWITATKPQYNYSEIQGTPDLSVYALASSLDNYALKTSIPTNNNQLTNGAGYITASALNGYATETFVNTAVNGAKKWVEEQQYLTGITSGMIESVLGYQPYDGDTNRKGFLTSSALNGYATETWVNTALSSYLLSANFTKANIKSTLGISDWALASTLEWSAVNGRPTKLSDLTDDVVAGKYLPLSGGTVNGSITATSFIGNLTGNADSATNADMLDGYHKDWFQYNVIGFKQFYKDFDCDANVYTDGLLWNYGNISYWKNAPPAIMYGQIFTFKGLAYSGLEGQLAWDINHYSRTDTTRALWWRAKSNRGWEEAKWHQIAFIDSNVFSATKLQTPRTIWGQSFDGTGNVTGDLATTGTIFAQNIRIHGTNQIDSYTDHAGGSPAGNLNLNYSSTGNVTIANGGGNVSIGGTTASAKLHVHGNLLTTGGITMYSQRSLKNILSYDGLSLEQLSVIKPIKFTWKDGRDNRYHVGGVADDVETVVPEVVYSANDFLTMDYGNAGFYVAASLIKPVIDHETRIKQLECRVKELEQENKQLKQAS